MWPILLSCLLLTRRWNLMDTSMHSFIMLTHIHFHLLWLHNTVYYLFLAFDYMMIGWSSFVRRTLEFQKEIYIGVPLNVIVMKRVQLYVGSVCLWTYARLHGTFIIKSIIAQLSSSQFYHTGSLNSIVCMAIHIHTTLAHL